MSKVYPDISHHHHVQDWASLKKSCPFLITKATQGTTFVDPYLDTIIKECEARKIPYWLYTFLNKGGEKAQAEFMVKICKNRVGKYFVGYILDIEQGNNADNCYEALKVIQKASAKTMIYTMYAEHAKYTNLISKRGKNCVWWEARYGLNNGEYNSKYAPHKGVDLHQFTSSGKCNGVHDRIDMNRLTGTVPESWFLTAGTTVATVKKAYSGTWPAFPESRSYYKKGDGYEQLKDYKTQIKRVQEFLTWAGYYTGKIDGLYGAKTDDAVRKFQKKYGLPVNGCFGQRCLKAAKALKK